ncbi:hypothetical protein TL16_g04843 [Triparma laevis f. inornata]|uniref:Kinesin-like protein n=1 Tax=Triparma laevis f. inornata TaxID=1714386 RepID=A0A9W7A997_9STRA|nr:hypothetical protein TL16_g04843 [Triparma laevis f. inornata]
MSGSKKILRNNNNPRRRAPPPPPKPVARLPPKDAGIIPRVVRALFHQSKTYSSTGDDVKITFSFVQLYNDSITDLLKPSSKNLTLREDPNLGVFVKNATQVVGTSFMGVLKVLRVSAEHRVVRSTRQNNASSRSHAVLRFTVTRSSEEKEGMSKVRRGTLTFVDLAGSERLDKSGITGQAVKEARRINRSISCLGNVISALGKGTNVHVPFRDEKLTWLLRETLGGKSQCVLIANLSNQQDNSEENLMTLNFASSAMRVDVKPVKFETFAKTVKKKISRPGVGDGAVFLKRTSNGNEKTKNQLLAEQYKADKKRSLKHCVADVETLKHNNKADEIENLHLIDQIEQLEAENQTLKRLLSIKNEGGVDKGVVDPNSMGDLLELDTVVVGDSHGEEGIFQPYDVFAGQDFTAPGTGRKVEFDSSLGRKADTLVSDVEQLKKDLMSMGEAGGGEVSEEEEEKEEEEEEEMHTPMQTKTPPPSSSTKSSPTDSIDNFFSAAPSSWESERQTLKKVIDSLQKELAMKNVKISVLESRLCEVERDINGNNVKIERTTQKEERKKDGRTTEGKENPNSYLSKFEAKGGKVNVVDKVKKKEKKEPAVVRRRALNELNTR